MGIGVRGDAQPLILVEITHDKFFRLTEITQVCSYIYMNEKLIFFQQMS